MFLKNAPEQIRRWAITVILSIDPSERAHGAFRVQFRTGGKGRDQAVTADTFLCHQRHASHQNKGGHDLTKRSIAVPLTDSTTTGPIPLPASLKPQRHGGPYVAYRNIKMAVYKQLRSPASPMTDGMIDDATERITTLWFNDVKTDPALYQHWVTLAKYPEKQTPLPLADSIKTLQKPEYKPLWSSVAKESGIRDMVPECQLVACLSGSSRSPDRDDKRRRRRRHHRQSSTPG